MCHNVQPLNNITLEINGLNSPIKKQRLAAKLLCDTIMVDICHYSFLKPTEYETQRETLNMKHKERP
jgi:hypothetical protein